jgi:hypothetical protein
VRLYENAESFPSGPCILKCWLGLGQSAFLKIAGKGIEHRLGKAHREGKDTPLSTDEKWNPKTDFHAGKYSIHLRTPVYPGS